MRKSEADVSRNRSRTISIDLIVRELAAFHSMILMLTYTISPLFCSLQSIPIETRWVLTFILTSTLWSSFVTSPLGPFLYAFQLVGSLRSVSVVKSSNYSSLRCYGTRWDWWSNWSWNEFKNKKENLKWKNFYRFSSARALSIRPSAEKKEAKKKVFFQLRWEVKIYFGEIGYRQSEIFFIFVFRICSSLAAVIGALRLYSPHRVHSYRKK